VNLNRNVSEIEAIPARTLLVRVISVSLSPRIEILLHCSWRTESLSIHY
jgi:hypothetical protein